MNNLDLSFFENKISSRLSKVLIRTVFTKWKSSFRQSKSLKSVQNEHNDRKSRIDSLLGRLSHLNISEEKYKEDDIKHKHSENLPKPSRIDPSHFNDFMKKQNSNGSTNVVPTATTSHKSLLNEKSSNSREYEKNRVSNDPKSNSNAHHQPLTSRSDAGAVSNNSRIHDNYTRNHNDTNYNMTRTHSSGHLRTNPSTSTSTSKARYDNITDSRNNRASSVNKSRPLSIPTSTSSISNTNDSQYPHRSVSSKISRNRETQPLPSPSSSSASKATTNKSSNHNSNIISSKNELITQKPSSSSTNNSTNTNASTDAAYLSRAAERWERTSQIQKRVEERISLRKKEEERINAIKEEEEAKAEKLLREQKRIEMSMKRRKYTGEISQQVNNNAANNNHNNNHFHPISSSSSSSAILNGMNPHERDLHIRADKQYRNHLLLSCGLLPWLKLIQNASQYKIQAKYHYHMKLLRKIWYALQGYCKSFKLEKQKVELKVNSIATSHYRKYLCRKIWRQWKSYGRVLKAKALAVWKKASRYKILERSLILWKRSLEKLRRINSQKWSLAEKCSEKFRKRYYWSIWLQWIEDNRIQREIDKRSELAWNKVQGWLN